MEIRGVELSFKGWNVVDEWKGEMFEMNWRRKECISTRIELGQNPVRSSDLWVRSSEPGSVWFGAHRRWFARATLMFAQATLNFARANLWSLERTCPDFWACLV